MARNGYESILEELRENYDFAVAEWGPIYREGAEDMRFVSGDPWPEEERKKRENESRPCLTLDELNQYCNQAINNLRQNKRAIRVSPKGHGANDASAEFKQGKARQIEYESNAQTAYITAFENMIHRSYGYFRITAKYRKRSMRQDLRIVRIANPDTVLPDPAMREADGSDMGWCFVLDQMTHRAFRQRFGGKAEITSFGSDLVAAYPQWVKDKTVQVAEYWKVETEANTLVEFPDGQTAMLSELEGHTLRDGKLFGPDKVLVAEVESRTEETRKVCQYLTNGIEILEKVDWAGEHIPVFPVFGKEMYLGAEDGSERRLLSLIRLARDPFMLYCFIRTCEHEVLGISPKVHYIGYEGQFEGHEDEWGDINRIPRPYVEVKPIVDAATGTVLPLPQRQVYEPPIQALEIAAESAKRSIQSAMGMYNASVGKHDTNVKSGKAIKELDTQSQVGNFHFIDNFDVALRHAGRVLDELIPIYYGDSDEEMIRKPDDTSMVIPLRKIVQGEGGEEIEERLDISGEHDVTISTGPSYDDQREQADEFAQSLIGQGDVLGAALSGNAQAGKLLSLAVKLRNLGPIGDQIADLLDPENEEGQEGEEVPTLPPAIQERLQVQDQMMEALTQQLNELVAEQKAKTAELESKERIAAADNETQVALAQLKAQIEREKIESDERIAAMKAEMDRMKAEMARDKADSDRAATSSTPTKSAL